MENTSPFVAMQQVERELKELLRTVDTDPLEVEEKKALAQVRRLAIDARLDIREYEFSETRARQLKCGTAAKKRLAKLQAAILASGSVFSPADVAQLGAQLEHIDNGLL